jgi:anti-sigma regulatory factor (Ser/Thr protein kinase)
MVDDVRSYDALRRRSTGPSTGPGGAGSVAPPFERRMPASTSNLAELRRTLRAWLEATVDDAGRHADIVLAASELAVAAMRAVPTADDAVAVAAWLDDDSVVVESRAETSDEAVVGGPSRAFDGNDGERGFSIVASLSDVLAVKGARRGVVVRAQLPNHRFGSVRRG